MGLIQICLFFLMVYKCVNNSQRKLVKINNRLKALIDINNMIPTKVVDHVILTLAVLRGQKRSNLDVTRRDVMFCGHAHMIPPNTIDCYFDL